MDENVTNFVSITGASADVASGFLQVAGGDFESAVGLYYENPDLVSGVGAGVTGGGTTATSHASASQSRQRNIGRQDERGVIHISDDEDDDDAGRMQLDDDDIRDFADYGSDGAAAAQAEALVREEEDAAMAKRLQEELYQGAQGSGDDNVRAPIARTTETLVGGSGPGHYGDWPPLATEDDDDAMAILMEQQQRLRQRLAGQPTGPFNQQIWVDGSSSREPITGNGTHARRLEDLFRPPFDLMTRTTWEGARRRGREAKKWILINLQDMSDFNCQALNRDIWKDEAVREVVSENFIFLQYDKDWPGSEEYKTFYFPHQTYENPDNYPHVSIVDPRTGEQVKVWSGRPFPSASDFHSELVEFLDRYSLEANSKNPVAQSTTRVSRAVDVERMTEEEMLEMALKNSLAGASGSGTEAGSRASASTIADPDALTKASAGDDSGSDKSLDKGKGKERQATQSEVATSPFSRIAGDKPHAEPEQGATGTTRIQFRHPEGRVIRRFQLGDPVRRLYEWLKAEPLEGKEGIEFELKRMPQGQDLLGSLDEAIEDAGLKQGTVMIEFL